MKKLITVLVTSLCDRISGKVGDDEEDEEEDNIFDPVFEDGTQGKPKIPKRVTVESDDSSIRKMLLSNLEPGQFGRWDSKNGRNSIHLFPTTVSGKKCIKISFVLQPDAEKDLTWEAIDKIIKKKGDGLNSIMSKITRHKPVRKLYVKVKNYGPKNITSWVPLFPDLLPDLPEEYSDNQLYASDLGVIGYYQMWKDGLVDFSTTKTQYFTMDDWRSMSDRIIQITGNNSVVLPVNDVIFTISFQIPIENDGGLTLEELSDVINTQIHGYTVKRETHGNDVLYLQDIYFHSSARYQDGMFNEHLVYRDGKIIKEEIDF
jgi:hypothetical protein